MPLYEWRCPLCDLTFEALVALGAARRKRRCPACRGFAARVMSDVTVLSSRCRAPAPNDGQAPAGRPDVTQLPVPAVARPCWMDDRAAARFAAYKHGRGAEYDDTVAARAEARKKYGTTEKETPARARLHSHSPLADPQVFARRAAAARRSSEGR
jgi:putative FmdB family regulatory protein